MMARFALLALLAAGCAAQIGDACESSVDCGRGLQCDLSQPEGYCTATPCDVNDCPTEAACIRFLDDSTWCMARCEEDGDCRDGYVCVRNFGDTAFCNSQPFTAK